MRDAVPRPQPTDLRPSAFPGGKPVVRQCLRFALGDTARHRFKRLGDAVMQSLPPRRQQAFVGDVADERVLEPEVPAALRDDEPGLLQRGKPLLVYPGKVVMWDAMPPGNALISIADAKAPARAIYQGTITVGTDDLFFSVLPDVPAPKAKLEPISTPIPAPPGR